MKLWNALYTDIIPCLYYVLLTKNASVPLNVLKIKMM